MILIVIGMITPKQGSTATYESSTLIGITKDVAREYTPTPTNTPTITPTPMSTATPVPSTATPTVVPYVSGTLTESQMVGVLRSAGWPEYLISEALIVSFKESRWNPLATSWTGCCHGLFQLHEAYWPAYCGITYAQLFDPYQNAACAYKVYLYDIAQGNPRWNFWDAKPW